MLAAPGSMLERPMTAQPAARVVTIAAVLVPLAGCTYLQDRGRDFTDMVDVKGGMGGYGLGAKVRATEAIGTGVGFGAVYDTREKIGRRVSCTDSALVGLVVFAMDGEIGVCPGRGFEISFLGLRVQDETATRPWSWLRFGGEAVLPGVRGGLFVNLGEFVDFLAGIAGLDPVGDDRVTLWAPLEEEPPPAHHDEKLRAAPEETERKAEK